MSKDNKDENKIVENPNQVTQELTLATDKITDEIIEKNTATITKKESTTKIEKESTSEIVVKETDKEETIMFAELRYHQIHFMLKKLIIYLMISF